MRLVRGRALAGLSRWAEAQHDLAAALELTPVDALEARAEILMHLTSAAFWSLDIEGAQRHGKLALEISEHLGLSAVMSNTLGLLAHTASAAGYPLDAIAWVERAEAAAGGRYVFGLASASQYAYWLSDLGRARDQAVRHVALVRAVGDVSGLMLALPALGLALGASGRYREAFEALEEARQVGRRHGVDRLAARATSIIGGLRMELHDLDGALAFAEEARAAGQALAFPPALVSASLDALFIHLRRGDAPAARALFPGVADAVGRGTGWHGWLWTLRFAAAKAELSLVEGRPDEALAAALPLLSQDPRRYRPKYHALGLEISAGARVARGEEEAALADLDRAADLARGHENPLMLLRPLVARLALGEDAAVRAEARGLVERIAPAVPEGEVRAAFLASEPVRRVIAG